MGNIRCKSTLHATILGTPAVDGLLTDAVFTHQVLYLHADFMLFENRNDLFVAVSLALHLGSSVGSE